MHPADSAQALVQTLGQEVQVSTQVTIQTQMQAVTEAASLFRQLHRLTGHARSFFALWPRHGLCEASPS